MMKKKIDFPPYTEADVKQIMEDGSLLCDLYGEKLSDDQNTEAWHYTDTDIVFRPDSDILSLTDDERRQIEEEILTPTDFSEIDPGFFVKI